MATAQFIVASPAQIEAAAALTVLADTRIAEPTILTAKCYFWSSGCSADKRRRAETRNAAIVTEYLKAIGLTVTRHEPGVVEAEHAATGVEVRFAYQESCANVYKHLSVTRNGKTSNITTLRKIAQASGVAVVR